MYLILQNFGSLKTKIVRVGLDAGLDAVPRLMVLWSEVCSVASQGAPAYRILGSFCQVFRGIAIPIATSFMEHSLFSFQDVCSVNDLAV